MLTGFMLATLAFSGWSLEPGEASTAKNGNGPAVLLGSAEYLPTPENPTGLRGDWTGRFAGANPPLTWSRVAKGLPGFACEAAKPAGNPAQVENCFAFNPHDWLVLGVFEGAKLDETLDAATVPPAAAPVEGDKTGDKTWQKAPAEHGLVCGGAIFGPVSGA